MVNQKYVFPFFNILLYAQEHIFKFASAKETREENRDLIYQLYDKAHNLEPKPDEPELTYTQRMLINRAKEFVTKKMEKRMRVNNKKRKSKLLKKLGFLISSKMFDK